MVFWDVTGLRSLAGSYQHFGQNILLQPSRFNPEAKAVTLKSQKWFSLLPHKIHRHQNKWPKFQRKELFLC
jgi:hypothetical protein